ncbi:MAG: hypothetical protein M3367_18550 [Acidobacteriota bacterium]|nr:hypothetical protein [Acidobacteriota bacterium]
MGNNILDTPRSQRYDSKSEYPLEYEERNFDYEGDEFTDFMEFRLIYEGQLKGSGNKNPRVSEKHAIRKQIHKQLAELWKTHPTLISMSSHIRLPKDAPLRSVPINDAIGRGAQGDHGSTYVETMARQFDRCGFHFVPLVSKGLDFVCSLNILFLRRENPGDLLAQGGDIDNRIKTLFDALRIPSNCNEVVGTPEPDENPFYCLLEDDCLVTELSVTTDRLLTPLKEGQHKNEVVLIIQVKAKAVKVTFENLSLL